ncbi:MAG: Abi family protein [Bacilli bacterium]|nr:Abi family protein [Bacilli bacterium]
MGKKIFKTIDEQIEILKNKGLSFDNFENPDDVLVRENYFFLNGYRHLFLKSKNDSAFIEGTNFSELYALFSFDRQLRNILFKNILIVENNVKSIYSYVISKNHGYKESSYLDSSIFTKDQHKVRQINDLIRKMKRQIKVNGKQHNATKHYIQNYGYLPLWIVVKVLSFGIISEVYSILTKDDQEEIASYFNTKVENLLIYLPVLSNYRNLCAHEDICYEHKSLTSIYPTLYHSLLEIPKIDEEYIYGLNDLFSLIIILKSVLRKEDFSACMNEISYELDVLGGKLHTINISKVLDRMGFPPNYKEIIRL